MSSPHYPERFLNFHEANLWIYAGIVRHARDLQAEGYTQVGMRYLFEHQRYTQGARRHTEIRESIEYGMDNNFSPYYARLIMEQEIDLAGFFRTRRTEGEAAAADAAQVAMEFD